MIRTILIISLFTFIFSFKIQAQEVVIDTLQTTDLSIFEELNKTDNNGKVTFVQDRRIVELINRSVRISKKDQTIKGCRIRIFDSVNQGARNQAAEVVKQFNETFPDIPAYMVYLTPSWRVYVGDYRTRDDAKKDLKKIVEYYRDAFVNDNLKINFPKL